MVDVSAATDITVSTLQRIENDDDVQVGYQTVRKLAKYYNVSTDYLFGLTDNLQHRNVAIDELRLTDAAVEVLRAHKLNNRLIGELLTHPDTPSLFSAMEMYIDRKILPQMNTMNAVYKMAETVLREDVGVDDNDTNLKLLQEAVVDEDEYLRFRITERFSVLMRALFDAHKKDALPEEQASVIAEIRSGFQTYQDNKKTEGAARAKMVLFAKQLGLNISKLTDEEVAVLMKALEGSELYKKTKRRK